LSVMGQPFSSVALHDLKTPLNATAMLLRNISDGLCGPLTEKQSEWLSKCQRRLSELSSMLHNFEILAMLDSESVEKQRRGIEIGPFLENIAEEYRDTAESHGHFFTVDTNQNAAVVMGLTVCFMKQLPIYWPTLSRIRPRGRPSCSDSKKQEDMVVIELEDTAIGMAEEDRSRLFGESVRFSAEAASNHNVPGTTLGFSIVKRIVDIHDGKVEFNSTPGGGGVFRIILPRSNQP
ncbi:MAG: HAMP domain-containing sensor histidine kinase, partial [Candidatus Hydrogenedentes bacterium]|nr:HAMP domain-containing sensor histidine kinase [Candidatus Hydrogenedentota bacterium]